MELGLRRGQLGVAHREHGPVFAIVGLEERCARLDHFAFLDKHLGDHARDIHADRDVLARASTRPDPAIILRAGTRRRLDDRLRQRLRLPRLDHPRDREKQTNQRQDRQDYFVNIDYLLNKCSEFH